MLTPGWRFISIPLALVALMLTGVQLHSQGSVDQYRIEAVFLFNFTKFVDWPATAFKTVDEPIRICVFGQNPFDSALEETVYGKTVGNRTFIVREVSNRQEADTCHVLFFGRSAQQRCRSLLDELKGRNILTVGETEDFSAHGGIVTFRRQDGRIRFTINAALAERANLRISSKLLSLAETSEH